MRVSEVYQSVQGEGPRVGTPTTFVRFGSCNLRCPGWPCDTQHAIDPAFRNEWEKLSPMELLERIPEWPKNVCFTGGEPMLQKESELQELVRKLAQRGQAMEMFTNGTLLYPDWLLEDVFIVMDWKLPGSGEADNQWGVNNAVRIENFHRLTFTDVVKFTIADNEDLQQAMKVYKQYFQGQAGVEKVMPMVYAGIVWGKEMDNAELVDHLLAAELPWKLNIQIHNHIWNREQRGI